MANTIKLKAEARAAHGSGEARRVRRAGAIPAALSRLTGGTQTIQLNAHEYMMAMRHEASDQVLVQLELDGETVHALLREVQRDVIDGSPIHADFSEVDMSKKIRASAAIRLVGEPDGVRNQGGVLAQATHEIQIECLPTDLVESFDVDVTELKIGDSITVADLSLGAAYTILTHGDTPIASVSAVKEEVVETPAEGEEPAAPEVLSKGKKEEEAPAAEAPAKGGKK
jgi:large subunit ribosomal protein L25